MATSHDYSHGGSVQKSRPEPFQSLEHVGSRTRVFWTSVGLHGVLLSILLIVPLLFTDTLRTRYDLTFLAPPPIRKSVLEVTKYKLPPPPKPKPAPRPVEKPPEMPKIAEVKLPPVIKREPPPLITKNTPIPEPPPPPPVPPPAPKPEVHTNVFPTETPATTKLPPRQVQTGGFGDPNGAKGDDRADKAVNIASLGAFDLPVGAGAGNGTGGAKGVVAIAGFGDGAAAAGEGKGGTRSVRQGSFGDADAGKPAAAPRKQDAGPPQIPAEILFKPRPEYTEDARNLKLEGEVLLRVMFTSTGQVKVLDIVRGLGHGLDESAVRAAQQIRFKPAQRDGQPVDSTATVHIVFQLAY